MQPFLEEPFHATFEHIHLVGVSVKGSINLTKQLEGYNNMLTIDSRMGQKTWVGVHNMTHAHAQWSKLCAIHLSYHRLELCTSINKNVQKR